MELHLRGSLPKDNITRKLRLTLKQLKDLKLAKHITFVHSPLAGQTEFNARNIQRLRGNDDVCSEEDDLLISFDVTSLFTNVPVEEAVDIVHGHLLKAKTLRESTSLSAGRVKELLGVLKVHPLQPWQGLLCTEGGCNNGSPISAVAINLYVYVALLEYGTLFF